MTPDLLAVLQIIARDVPFFAGFVVVWAGIFVVEIRLALLANRHEKRWTGPAAASPSAGARPGAGPGAGGGLPRGVEWWAAGGLALHLGCVVLSTAIARSRLLRDLSGDDTAARVRLVSQNLSGLLNALPFGVMAALPLVVLAAYTFAVCLWVRGKERGDDPSLPRFLKAGLAVAALCLVPVGVGVVGYSMQLIKIASGVAGVDPELRALMTARGMVEARPQLVTAVCVALCGLLATTGYIAVVCWRKARARASAVSSDADARARRVSGIAATSALALFAVSMTLHLENQAPWPEPSHNLVLDIGAFESSTVSGPDPMPWAPLLFVTAGDVLLEGTQAAGDRATEMLRVLHKNYTLLHPGASFPGQINVYCPAAVPVSRLDAALRVAADAGYTHPLLMWTQPGEIRRPLLGRLSRPNTSAARFELTTRDEGGALHLTGSCGAFGAELARLRRQGSDVKVLLANVADDRSGAR